MKSGFQITIRGKGDMYNNKPEDVDALAKTFTKQLVDAGYTIESAHFQPTEPESIKPAAMTTGEVKRV